MLFNTHASLCLYLTCSQNQTHTRENECKLHDPILQKCTENIYVELNGGKYNQEPTLHANKIFSSSPHSDFKKWRNFKLQFFRCYYDLKFTVSV